MLIVNWVRTPNIAIYLTFSWIDCSFVSRLLSCCSKRSKVGQNIAYQLHVIYDWQFPFSSSIGNNRNGCKQRAYWDRWDKTHLISRSSFCRLWMVLKTYFVILQVVTISTTGSLWTYWWVLWVFCVPLNETALSAFYRHHTTVANRIDLSNRLARLKKVSIDMHDLEFPVGELRSWIENMAWLKAKGDYKQALMTLNYFLQMKFLSDTRAQTTHGKLGILMMTMPTCQSPRLARVFLRMLLITSIIFWLCLRQLSWK